MKHGLRRLCASVALLLMCSGSSAAEWVQTWGAAPLPPAQAQGPFPATPSFENATIRQTVRTSVGGGRVRLRLTNEYGSKPLVVGAVRIAATDDKGNVQLETSRTVLFDGKTAVTIPAGAPFLSDPVDLPVKGLSSLSISLYLPGATGPCTCHATGMQSTFVSDTGDFTAKAFAPKQTLQVRAFVSGVDVEVATAARAVVVLGDSISDGMGSTVDANRRWPDVLAARLNGSKGPGWGVVNMGISGNQLLADGAGQSALSRFDRDVLAVPGAKAVVVFLGVNDLGLSYGRFEGPAADFFKNSLPANKATADSMIAGYRQLIARAHARGLKVIAGTITPYQGAVYYADAGEAVRQRINQWIRSGREVDGVIDFDAVLRDPAKPTQIRDGYHSGDFLHGSDVAYEAMGAAVDLALLR